MFNSRTNGWNLQGVYWILAGDQETIITTLILGFDCLKISSAHLGWLFGFNKNHIDKAVYDQLSTPDLPNAVSISLYVIIIFRLFSGVNSRNVMLSEVFRWDDD